jgi:sortase A
MKPAPRLTIRLLEIAGTLAIGYSAFVLSEAYLFQIYEKWRFDRDVETPAPLRIHTTSEGLGSGSFAPPQQHSLVGRIDIPSLGLSTMILEGDDERDLRLGAGHVPGTALPGRTGNVAIAAHRDTFFRPLKNLSKNDRIVVTTTAGSFPYTVESIEITRPENTAVLKPSAQPTLTLITCYPFYFVGAAPMRFVVHAKRVAG